MLYLAFVSLADQCEIWEGLRIHVGDHGGDAIAKGACARCTEYVGDMNNASTSRRNYMDDGNWEMPSNMAIYSGDLERILLLPIHERLQGGMHQTELLRWSPSSKIGQ